jgi:hypothetical protein
LRLAAQSLFRAEWNPKIVRLWDEMEDVILVRFLGVHVCWLWSYSDEDAHGMKNGIGERPGAGTPGKGEKTDTGAFVIRPKE